MGDGGGIEELILRAGVIRSVRRDRPGQKLSEGNASYEQLETHWHLPLGDHDGRVLTPHRNSSDASAGDRFEGVL